MKLTLKKITSLSLHTSRESSTDLTGFLPINFSLAEVEAKIVSFNEKQKDSEDIHTAELVTDKLTKKVCAYKQRSRPLDDLIKDAREIQESIDQAVEYLESALADLNRIRGLV
ncbi:MAG: hypothetical protein LBD29_04055 [Treponema sp.]|jgi:hypothetical protein|nr:hypothetical protein [Treponema sp.]